MLKDKPESKAETVKPKADKELLYKAVKRGNHWMAFSMVNGEWKPLLNDYTLASSAIGVIEDQLSRDVYK